MTITKLYRAACLKGNIYMILTISVYSCSFSKKIYNTINATSLKLEFLYMETNCKLNLTQSKHVNWTWLSKSMDEIVLPSSDQLAILTVCYTYVHWTRGDCLKVWMISCSRRTNLYRSCICYTCSYVHFRIWSESSWQIWWAIICCCHVTAVHAVAWPAICRGLSTSFERSMKYGKRQSSDSGGILFSSVRWRYMSEIFVEVLAVEVLYRVEPFQSWTHHWEETPVWSLHLEHKSVCFAVSKFFVSEPTIFLVSLIALFSSWCLSFSPHFVWESHSSPLQLFLLWPVWWQLLQILPRVTVWRELFSIWSFDKCSAALDNWISIKRKLTFSISSNLRRSSGDGPSFDPFTLVVVVVVGQAVGKVCWV